MSNIRSSGGARRRWPPPFADWPVRAKLAALVLVVSLLPITVMAVVEIDQTSQRIFNDETALLAARAEQLVAEIDAFHTGYQRAAMRVAGGAAALELLRARPADVAGRSSAMATRLHAFLNVDPALRGVAVVDANARVVATTEPALARRPLDRWRFVRDALAGAPVTELFVAGPELDDEPTIGYLCPVRGADRTVIGAVAFLVRASALWELAQRASGLAGPGSFAIVVDREGVRLVHTLAHDMVFHPAGALPPATAERLVAEQRYGAATRDRIGDVRPFPALFARARAAAFDPGLFEGALPVDGRSHYGVGRRLARTDWTVFYLVPAATMTAPMRTASHRHIAFAALVGMLALLTGGMFARHIVTPIVRLTAATRQIARGVRPLRTAAAGSDEIGALGAAFDAMADELYRSQISLEALVGQRTSALVDANRELRARELSLGASEQRFRELYEQSPDMYMTNDAVTQQITDCNQTLCNRLGYRRDELIGRPFYTVYPEDQRPPLAGRLAVFDGRVDELTDLERVLQCKDGRRIHASMSLRAIRDRDGKVMAVRALWRDITGRKQVEADQQFLLELADVLRSSTDAGDVLQPVCTRLASYLDASRCLFAEIHQASGTALVRRDYHAGSSSMSGVLTLAHFGELAIEETSAGKTLVIGDTATDPRTAASHASAYAPVNLHAMVSVPLLRDGHWTTSLMVAAPAPRVWQDREVGLIKLVAERVWSWVEHLRVLAELREQSVREAEQQTEARMLRTRQDELARSLKEREVLLQEIHHRVKNNLQVISSLINMQVRQLDACSSRDALEQCQTRVLAIALIHEKLYQSKDYSAVHFAEYARSLAANVFHALGVSQADITLELAIDDIPLGVDRAIPCGLVLNELITNALKHAFPGGRRGTIRVSLGDIGGGRIRLRVDDDGTGVPAGFDIQRATSMGLQLVCTLAEQLEAELAVTEGIGGAGTSFLLAFSGG